MAGNFSHDIPIDKPILYGMMNEKGEKIMWNTENPTTCEDGWVKWQDKKGNVIVSVGYWDGAEWCITQPAYENAWCDNYAFRHIGTVIGWQPMIPPDT